MRGFGSAGPARHAATLCRRRQWRAARRSARDRRTRLPSARAGHVLPRFAWAGHVLPRFARAGHVLPRSAQAGHVLPRFARRGRRSHGRSRGTGQQHLAILVLFERRAVAPRGIYTLSHASIKLRAPGALTQVGRQGVGVNARVRHERPTCSPPPLMVATGQRTLCGRDRLIIWRGFEAGITI